MKGFKVALVSTLLLAVLFQCEAQRPRKSYPNIDPSASVDRYADVDSSAQIEEQVVIGKSTKVGPKSVIMKGATVGDNTYICEYVRLGPESNIGDNVEIQDSTNVSENVTLNHNVEIGPRNTVLPGTVIASYVKSGRKVRFGRDNIVKNFASFKDSVETADGCVIDKYAELGAFTKLQKKSYIGQQSVLGSNVKVGASAVVHKETYVPDGTTIRDGEVFLSSPSSLDFFMDAAPISNLLDADVNAAQASDDSFNALMRDKASTQSSQFKAQCLNPPSKGMLLPQLKAFLLIRLYGKDRFIEIQNVINLLSYNKDIGFTNDKASKSIATELLKEFHFGRQPSKTGISPEVQDLVVRALAMQLDSERETRVEGDTVCEMAEEIASGKRAVRCSDRNLKTLDKLYYQFNFND